MIGDIVSHYKIVEKLGEGGMGVVYKAHDTKLDRSVALKFLSADLTSDPRQKERFINEAKSVSSLDHPNICTIYEIDESADGQMFIAMAAYEGVSLNQKIESGPLSLDDIINYSLQIVRGLSAAHEKGIIHRDIKSSNILVTNKREVKIIDFGLAKLRGSSHLTKTGRTVGTLAYMSPEQLRSDEVDNRSDIFSFGVVLYQMITGTLPFRGEYEEVIMYSIINQDPRPISEYRSDVPEELERIVLKCLEKNSDDRYQNVSEIMNELKQLRTSSRTEYQYGTSRHRTHSKQIVQSKRYILPLSISLLVLLVLIGVLFPNIRQIITELTGGPRIPSDIRLAVLPLRAIGDNPDDLILADGLTETIASRITQLELAYGALWVVPASEIRQRNIRSASEARRVFGANLSIDGSLYRDAQKLFLTLNLVDTKTIRQLRSWNTTIDKESFADLQQVLITQTAEMLNIELQPEHIPVIQRGMTRDSRAYELYLEARGHLQRYDRIDNVSYAIALFERSVSFDPMYSLAYAGLGEAYWRMYEATRDAAWIDHALKSSNQALELEDDIASIYVTLGMIHFGTGEYEKALRSFKRALDIDSVNSDAYRELARTYEALGDVDEVEITYKYAIQLQPTYWVGYNRLGLFYLRHNRYEEAIEQLRQVITLTPDNSWGYSNLGAVYQHLYQLDEARKYYERALSIAQDYGAASNLGTIYFTEGRYSDAAHMYEIARDLREREYAVWGNLASAYYWAQGKREDARSAYLQAIELAEERLEINPNDLEAIIAVASYYAAIEDHEQAYTFIQQALHMGLPTSEAMFQLGATHERLGERDEALYWIENALRTGYPKSYILVQPELQELFLDERFQKMIQEIPE